MLNNVATTAGTRYGYFTPIDLKIAKVMEWPGVQDRFSARDFTDALSEAHDVGKIHKILPVSIADSLVNLVVSISLDDSFGTFLFVCDQLSRAFGPAFQHKFGVEELANLRDRLSLCGDFVPNSIRIEAIDFGAHWELGKPIVPNAIAHSEGFVHAQALFAAAQDHHWIHSISWDAVPSPVMLGYRLTHCFEEKTELLAPLLTYDRRGLTLRAGSLNASHYGHSFPRTL